MKKVIVSAPGKVHLMGEHAVVYGKPALFAAVNLRTYVRIENASTGLQIVSKESPTYVEHAIQVVKQVCNIQKLPGLKITITSNIPSGYHLGSSAAVAVATVGALFYFLKNLWNPHKINEIAYEVEKKQHGNPSGGDNTIVTFGGFLWYRKELEFLKSIWQLPFKLHADLNHFFLINTGKPKESTGEMVAYVKSEYEKRKEKFQDLLELNEAQVKKLTVALKENRESDLVDAIKTGESTLEGMGAVSPKVMPFIRAVEKKGGVVKVLGGGGKTIGVGFLLCYARNRKAIEVLSKKYGYTTQDITLGEEGVRLEKGNDQ